MPTPALDVAAVTEALAAFVKARLDEAERTVYREGSPPHGVIAWLTYLKPDGSMGYTTVAHGDNAGGPWIADGKQLPEPASVLVVYDPERTLRDIAAKRAVVTRWEVARNQVAVGAVNERAGYGPADAGWALRADSHELDVCSLAAIWSGHPDYLEEFAV